MVHNPTTFPEVSSKGTVIDSGKEAFLAVSSIHTKSSEFVRDMEEDANGCTDEFWSQIVGQGWPGIGIPEEYGGTGGDFLDLGVLIENTGKYLMPGPLFSTVVLAGMTILDAGSDSQKSNWLPSISDGTLLATMAFAEKSGSYEWSDVETNATLSEGNYILDGTKVFVPYAQTAKLIIIPKNDYIYHTCALSIRLHLSHDAFGFLISSIVAEILLNIFLHFS